MNYKILIITICSVLFTLHTNANSNKPNGYKIEVRAPFKKGEMAYFASYWEGRTYAIDSAVVQKNGIAILKKDTTQLDAGQYLLLIKPEIQVDMLISEGQNDIKIELNEQNIFDSKITGSKDSKLYWESVKYLNEKYDEISRYAQLINDTTLTDSKKKEYMSEYSTKVDLLGKSINKRIEDNKGTWFSSYLRSMQEVKLPYLVTQTQEEHRENLKYAKEHHFDNIDFEDTRLWRTSTFTPMIDTYLKQWIIQHPDTIAKESSILVSKTTGNEKSKEMMLSYLINRSTENKYMGMENVWAKLAEDYILDKNNPWIDSTQYRNLEKEYSLIQHNRMGQKAKDMKLWTITGDSININDVEAEYTLLVFYSPNCSYCSSEITALRTSLYPKYKDKGLKVIAIYVDHNIDSWTGYIERKEMQPWINVFDPNYKSEYWMKYDVSGTPSVYLLDKDKIIIAKKLSMASLDGYLEQYIELRE